MLLTIKYYFIYSYIYNLIKKRNYLWKKMMKTLDPVRFSHNRFRQLLKQKKERKIIQMVIQIYLSLIILQI